MKSREVVKIREWQVIQGLVSGLHMRSVCMPHYTPRRWWECDVFELTRAGYFREYEIKLSVSDFRADGQKSKFNRLTLQTRNKHQLLAGRSVDGPSQFFYVTPQGLIRPQDLPEFAGLIEFFWTPSHKYPPTYRTVVRAPRLHNHRADPKLEDRIFRTSYYRLIHLMLDRDLRFDNEPPQGEGEDHQIPPSPSPGT